MRQVDCFQMSTWANSQVCRTGIKVQVDSLARSSKLDRTQPLTVISLSETHYRAS